MARKAKIEKSKRKQKFTTRTVRRCFKCGRERGVLRKFELCRICFREMANNCDIPGIRKAS